MLRLKKQTLFKVLVTEVIPSMVKGRMTLMHVWVRSLVCTIYVGMERWGPDHLVCGSLVMSQIHTLTYVHVHAHALIKI